MQLFFFQKNIFIVFLFLLSSLFISCSGISHKSDGITNVYNIFRTLGDGERICNVVLEYDIPVKAESVHEECFDFSGYSVSKLFVTDSVNGRQCVTEGRYVVIDLENCREKSVTINQIKPVVTSSGVVYDKSSTNKIFPFKKSITETLFWPLSYKSPYLSDNINYYVSLPENYSLEKRYPLIFFVSEGSFEKVNPLLQGNGACIWAEENEHTGLPAIVVAVQFPSYQDNSISMDSDGAFIWSSALNSIYSLYRHIVTQYSVDESKICGIGQYDGGSSILGIEARYPASFTTMLIINGYWNNFEMYGFTDKKIIFADCKNQKKALDSNYALCSILSIDASVHTLYFSVKDDKDYLDLNDLVKKRLFTSANIYHFVFDIDSNTEIKSFIYDLEAVRNWILK